MPRRPDVVMLTIDCWRHDAVAVMPRLRALADGRLHRREAICQSAATPGVFPAILASDYYPSVYDAAGQLADTSSTLPAVLVDHGYSAGAVVGVNPFLEPFRDEFDFFRNGGFGADGYRRVARYLSRQIRRRLRRQWAVPAPTVSTAAADWFRSVDGPRFLLMHLMDLHEPYYPGLARWLRVGPVRAGRALAQHQADRRSMTDAARATVERLYRECVDFVDAHINRLLSFVPDSAVLVVMGDHGEEFEHAAYRHARLYDECVRVPLFVRNLPGVEGADRVRQLDVVPSILRRLDVPVPTGWTGEPCDGTNRDSFMLNYSPHRDESYLGLRTDRYKYIWTFDGAGGHRTGTELYDLATDPRETRDLVDAGAEPALREELAARLAAFRDREDIETGLDRGTGSTADSGSRDDRLRALGYV